MITAFMLYCAMQPSQMNEAKIYFKSINDCTYYAEKLSGHCKLVPSINPDKVKVY